MNARNREHGQRTPQPPRTPRQLGVTLLEVMIAAALAVIVIAGLAAASISAARTNREAANLGAPERAIHEVLEHIASDLRTNNGDGAFRCGQLGSRVINGYNVDWRTYRVTLDASGNPTQQATCGNASQQSTLLVRGQTTDGNAQFTRETLVSLTRGTTPSLISFTSTLTEVRPGDNVTLSWRLADNPPAGTITYLDGERVHTDTTTLTGTTTVTITETATFELVADSPFGQDSRTVTVDAGNAPIFRVLRTTPERYTPGEPLTFHWEIDPAPLALTNARRLAANQVAAQNLPTNGDRRATGRSTVTVPASQTGQLTFPFTATSAGGETRKSITIQECPRPTARLSASPDRINREGSINTTIVLSWSLTNAASATLTVQGTDGTRIDRSLAGLELTTGELPLRILVPEGSTYSYAASITAESECGRATAAPEQVTIYAQADEVYIPKPEPNPDPDPDPDLDDGEPKWPPDEPETCADLDWDHVYCACYDKGWDPNHTGPPEVVCLDRN